MNRKVIVGPPERFEVRDISISPLISIEIEKLCSLLK